MKVTIDTQLTAQEVADLVGNWGQVLPPPTIPDVPFGYEVRQVQYREGEGQAPGDKLWVLVPKGYPPFIMVFSYKRLVCFGDIWREDLNIPYRFAPTVEEATIELVRAFATYPEYYNFGRWQRTPIAHDTPAPAIPAGYKIVATSRSGKRGRMGAAATGDKLWAIVPVGYPQLLKIRFAVGHKTYVFASRYISDWRIDLDIPHCFAATIDDAARLLVPELLRGRYNFVSEPYPFKF